MTNNTGRHLSITQEGFGLQSGVDIIASTQTIKAGGACEVFVSPRPQGLPFGTSHGTPNQHTSLGVLYELM